MGIERADVVCPFYSYDDGERRIVCEGLADRSTLSQRFGRKKAYEAYMEHYCFRNCTECEIFRLLIRTKYADT